MIISILKGLGRYFHAETKKSIFHLKKLSDLGFYKRKVMKVKFWSQKSIFSFQR